MTDIPKPAVGDTSWDDWATDEEAMSDRVKDLPASVKEYGAVGDGTTNDTAAFASALAAHTVVHVPTGSYKVTGITVPDGKALTGDWSRSYTGTPTGGARLIANTSGQTAAVVTLAARARIENIAVVGLSTTHDGIKLGSINLVQNCTVSGAGTGINGLYSSVNQITGNQIHDCNVGIKDVVDSQVVANYVNQNTSDGIQLNAGANANVVADNKVEWNNGRGIVANQTFNNIIHGNAVDRSGLAGIWLHTNTATVVADNVLTRNGALASGDQDDDVHIFQEANTRLQIVGNTTATGANDDSSGYLSPAATLWTNAGTDVVISSNGLGGATTTPVLTPIVGTRVIYIGNTGLAGVQPITNSRSVVGEAAAAIATTATGTFPFGATAVSSFSHGESYRLRVWSRDGSAVRGMAELPFLVVREGGAASVSAAPVENKIGTLFGFGTGTYQLGVTVNTDGSTITVTCLNSSAGGIAVGVRLT